MAPLTSKIPPCGSVVGTIADRAGLEHCLARPESADPCDFLEIRIDSLAARGGIPRPLPDLARPVLLTVRHPAEGGEGGLASDQRVRLYREHLPGAALVDIEIRSLPGFREVVEEARERGIPWIASFHDFAGTPARSVLRRRVDRATALGADLVKIAVRLHSCAELTRLASLFDSHPEVPLCLMGMGPLGGASRILLSQLGSRLNYGYTRSPNAPGQPSARLLDQCRRELG